MKQYKIQKYTLKNKHKTSPTQKEQRPPTFAAVFRSPFRAPSTAAWGLRLGGLRRRPSNTLSTNSKGKHETKEECTQHKSMVGVQYFNFKN